MRMRKRGAFRNEDVVLDALEPQLAAEGFHRDGHLFHRVRGSGEAQERIEAISVCLGNTCRTVWLHVSTKFPAAMELLNEVRPFTFQRSQARRVPGFRSDVACQLRLQFHACRTKRWLLACVSVTTADCNGSTLRPPKSLPR